MKMLKRMWKRFTFVALIMTVIALVIRKTTTAYFGLFGAPTKAPKSFRDNWQDVKDTLGFDTARDMDSPEIIKERRRDLGLPD